MTEMIKMEQHQPTKMEAQDEDEGGDNMDENINFENPPPPTKTAPLSDDETPPSKKRHIGLTKENVDKLQNFIKESEKKFEDITDILCWILNGDNSSLPENSFNSELSLISQDILNMRKKLDVIENNVQTLRAIFTDEKGQINLKQLNDIKEEVREDWTKFRSNAFNGIYNTDDLLDFNCDTELIEGVNYDPKMEQDDYYEDNYYDDYYKPKKKKKTKKKDRFEFEEKKSKQQKYQCDLCNKKVLRLDFHKEKMHGTTTAKKFTCHLCYKTFKLADNFANHKDQVHNTKLKCQICNFTHSKRETVRQHMFNCHEPIEVLYYIDMDRHIDIFQCSIKACPFESVMVQEVHMHMKVAHDRTIDINNKLEPHLYGDWKCQECDFAHFSMLEVKQHMERDHFKGEKVTMFVTEVLKPESKHLLCHTCPFSTKDQEAMDLHLLTYHKAKAKDSENFNFKKEINDSGQVYHCNRCHYETRNEMCYLDHVNAELRFKKCPFCDEHFILKDKEFTRHLQKHGKIYDFSIKQWVCQDCPIKFKRDGYAQFLSHLYNEHKIGTPYHCPKCDFSTGTLNNIKLHATIHEESQHPCPDCSFIAKSKHRLAKHIYNAHTSFDCRACDIKFKVKEDYNHHLKDHKEVEASQEEKCICDHCGDFFMTHKEYFLHKIKVRKDAKPTYPSLMPGEYFCKLCNVKCNRQQALDKHMQVKHPAECSLVGVKTLPMLHCQAFGCEYKTKISYNLKQHVEKVHEGIRWPCDQCKFVGGYKADLKRHVKIVHEGFALFCDYEKCTFSTPHQYVMNKHKDAHVAEGHADLFPQHKKEILY